MRRINTAPYPQPGDCIKVETVYRILDTRNNQGYHYAGQWSYDQEMSHEYSSPKAALDAVLTHASKHSAVQHLEHCVIETVERVTKVKAIAAVPASLYAKLAEEVRLEDLVDNSNLNIILHNHYLRYHQKAVSGKNKYHYAFILDMSAVEKWSNGMPADEYKELFGTSSFYFYSDNYRHAVSMLCKRINIRYPKVAYDSNILIFADLKDAIYFKLQYAEIPMKATDFKAVYANYLHTGKLEVVAF